MAIEPTTPRTGSKAPNAERTTISGREIVEDFLDGFRSQILHVLVIDSHHRRRAASGETLDFLKAEQLVLGLATGMDAGNALHFQVSTNPSIGPTTTISATVTQIKNRSPLRI